MVYITENGVTKKYACRTCIKGHRSTKCNHSERELIEIKRKGRPVSQCTVCRELRKTKAMHIKCICRGSKLTKTSPTVSPMKTTKPETSSLSSTTTADTDVKDLLSRLCPRCNRAKSFCDCAYTACLGSGAFGSQEFDAASSGSSSDDAATPASVVSMPNSLSCGDERYNMSFGPRSASPTLPPLRLAHPPAAMHSPPLINLIQSASSKKLVIPIHDPADDIDSDTPSYKEHKAPDRAEVLGELSYTTSEDLMNRIYGRFSDSHVSNIEQDES